MPCYHPLTAQRNKFPNENGKFEYRFGGFDSSYSTEFVSCGRCIGCRLEYSRQWALRCVHESKLHDDNCFLTLTYDDEHLPSPPSLETKKELSKFHKKLWQYLDRNYDTKLRYYTAGEYGDRTGRPHYHSLIFGWYPDASDLKPVHKNKSGDIVYTSESLSKLWGKGKVDVGELTFESAAYVARYVTKKVNGKRAKEHYKSVDLKTGEIYTRLPEYSVQSTKPAIAKEFYLKYKSDFDKGYITHNGVKMALTAYYNKLFEKEDPERYERLKEQKTEFAESFFRSNESNKDRLLTKERVKKSRIKSLKRGLDQDG